MKQEFITVGTVVNAHGIRGEVKINPAGGIDPALIARMKALYIGGTRYEFTAARVHKNTVLAAIPGVEDMDGALALKGKSVTVARADAKLKKGEYFDVELLDCAVTDAVSGTLVGKVTDVIAYPAHKVMEVQGEQTYLIPMVDKVFVESVDVDKGEVVVHMMKGLEVT